MWDQVTSSHNVSSKLSAGLATGCAESNAKGKGNADSHTPPYESVYMLCACCAHAGPRPADFQEPLPQAAESAPMSQP